MDIRKEIESYLDCKEATGALLLTGEWGCGKSYLIKEIAKEFSEKKIAIAVISLFGITEVKTLNQRVQSAYFALQMPHAKKIKKAAKPMKEGTKKLIDTTACTISNPVVSAVVSGVTSVLESIDFSDLLKVSNTLKKDMRFALVFDDFERCKIDAQDLFGAINDYVENKNIKTIIVADENKINTEKCYNDYKEKVISRTVKIKLDKNAVVDTVVDGYNETELGYKDFLRQNIVLVRQLFGESSSQNIRILKYILADFERVFGYWQRTSVSTENMKWVLYTFGAERFEASSKEDKQVDISDEEVLAPIFNSNKRFLNKGEAYSSFDSLSEWINTGYWNEDAFISELIRKYGDSEIQPWELFLWKNFWDLDKQDIDKGFSEVVEKAYSGDLSCEQIISFLIKVQMLQSVKIPFPCEVDPSKMVKGLNERFLRVITEKTEESERYSVVEIENIAPEWKELYNTAMRFENRVIMNKQKKRFIAYLDNGLYNEKIAISKMCFESFDSEMLKTFKKSYAQSNNAKKRKSAELLLGLCFNNQEFSTSEDMAVTKKNFCDLSEWLSLQETDDEITSYINKSFIEKIGELNIMK